MSSALDKMVPVFTSSNWQQWHTAMEAYLRAQGQWFVYGTAHPNEEHNTWDEHNEKALGNMWVTLLMLLFSNKSTYLSTLLLSRDNGFCGTSALCTALSYYLRRL